MRYSVNYTLAATLVAGAAASHHGHGHFHAKKGSPVVKREAAVVTEYVVGPTETVYELAGEVVDGEEAEAGIDGGSFIVVGETVPTYVPPPPPPPPPSTTSAAPTTTEVPELGAQFFESKEAAPTTSAAPAPAPIQIKAKPKPKPKPLPPVEVKPIAGSIDSDFPSGKIKCSDFPEEYGAQPLEWLGLSGWSGLQIVPGYQIGALSISKIITGILGDDCTKETMCSYACPAGYQKLQWPEAQGSTKESIGGLYCNSNGYLELTSPTEKKLCGKGAGGVFIKNDLDEVVNTCRTDYPGTESMVVPATAEPGASVELCNPVQDKYYIWDGMATSAQYYINKKGLAVKDACVWDSPSDPEGAGNWSPIIAGVGKASDGITYLSIFQNLPTSNAKLDFNIEITGDVSIECSYIDGQWSSGGDGCTTAMKAGGKATFRYF